MVLYQMSIGIYVFPHKYDIWGKPWLNIGRSLALGGVRVGQIASRTFLAGKKKTIPMISRLYWITEFQEKHPGKTGPGSLGVQQKIVETPVVFSRWLSPWIITNINPQINDISGWGPPKGWCLSTCNAWWESGRPEQLKLLRDHRIAYHTDNVMIIMWWWIIL